MVKEIIDPAIELIWEEKSDQVESFTHKKWTKINLNVEFFIKVPTSKLSQENWQKLRRKWMKELSETIIEKE